MVATERTPTDEASPWATGFAIFASMLMIMLGVLHAIMGFVALFNDDFYVRVRNYTFDLDITGWGWIHLILGILMLVVGFGLFGRRTWAGVTAIMLAMLSALANFFFIPYYPIWSLLEIGLAVWVIWALTRPGAIET